MKKVSCYFLFLFVFAVYGEEQEDLPVISQAEELKTVKSKQIIWQKDGAKMVLIPDEFEIVPTETVPAVYDEFGDLVKTETIIPEKKVRISNAFFMDAHEVTVGQFKTFLKSSGYKPDPTIDWNQVYKFSPTEKHPMIYVDWYDAKAYTDWAGKRLPTEEEWEWAVRGGLKNKEYSWSNDESLARDYANFIGIGGRDKWDRTTAPVGSLKPNGYGLYDMVGNVWEWCQDWFLTDDTDQKQKVLRGGSWLSPSDSLRLAYRDYGSSPINGGNRGGFRCVSGSIHRRGFFLQH